MIYLNIYQIVGFIIGWFKQDFQITVVAIAAGALLSAAVCVANIFKQMNLVNSVSWFYLIGLS